MTESNKFSNIKKLLERTSPFVQEDFEPNKENFNLLSQVKILVVGAGGLGCELLKDLALMGFGNLHVIDMDTIDLSNLNRQFLFRPKDIGRPKAHVAAEFINSRIKHCHVTPYYNRIEDMDVDFYRQFNIVVCGLDAIVARRWINSLLLSLLEFDEESGNVDPSSIIPLIDGGTEGFKGKYHEKLNSLLIHLLKTKLFRSGNARLILPGLNACIDCTLDLYPPQTTFPLCTIATTPRLPEHCIEYARIMSWPQEKPFGDIPIDGDDPSHIKWLYEKSLDR